jgi:cytochrome c peroxidase
MRFFKKKLIRILTAVFSFLTIIGVILGTGILSPQTAEAALTPLDPNAVRAAVQQMGMDSLSKVILTDPPELVTYVRPTPAIVDATTVPATPAPPANIPTPRQALLILGKALFWDQQVGSDGQACASCHFQAGADIRSKNVMNPGSRNTNVAERTVFSPVGSAPTAAAPARNYQFLPADFPFHKVSDPLDTSYVNRTVTFDTDDILGSQGTFHAGYGGSPVPNYTLANATGTYDTPVTIADTTYAIGTQKVRSSGPRQASSAINAVFNFHNFWDGRANNIFNGVDLFGKLSPNAQVYINNGTSLTLTPAQVSNSSLASQSVGPPNSAFSDEMAFSGRTFPDLGRKLLRLTATATTPAATIIPLGAQLVDATDSVLGPYKNAAGTNGGRGINVTYQQLIMWAFQPQWWSSAGPPIAPAVTPSTLTVSGYQLMEENFALFWGLAIQEYETTLRADQSRYDKFMAGDNTQLTQDEMRGLLTYIHTENTFQQVNPVFNNINFGACQLCHSGPELTEDSLVNVPAKFFITTDMTVTMDHNRELAIVPPSSSFDVGFTNVGSRPTREDIGHGDKAANGWPLSFWRQFITGLVVLPGPFAPLAPPAPNPDRGSNTDGAFKIPSLRNIELTGPYFHNGGTLTLKQAVEFYARHGDFADVNDPNIDVGLAMVQNITDADADLIVKFLLTLTDDRVKIQAAPFDHPQIFLPNGHPATATNHPRLGAGYRADTILTLPAVGAAGGPALTNFLGISNTPVAGANNDQFDP